MTLNIYIDDDTDAINNNSYYYLLLRAERERVLGFIYFARGTNEYNFAKNADSPTPFIDSLY